VHSLVELRVFEKLTLGGCMTLHVEEEEKCTNSHVEMFMNIPEQHFCGPHHCPWQPKETRRHHSHLNDEAR
jgi:hypothetical protein